MEKERTQIHTCAYSYNHAQTNVLALIHAYIHVYEHYTYLHTTNMLVPQKKVADFLISNNLISQSEKGSRQVLYVETKFRQNGNLLMILTHNKLMIKMRTYSIHFNVCSKMENLMADMYQCDITSNCLSDWSS